MNQLPTYIAEMATNPSGQIVLNQRSLFSFFHNGVACSVQLTRNYYKGLNMGSSHGYNVRMLCFVGILPLSIQGGHENRNKLLTLIYRSNYQPDVKFYVNNRQMIVGVSKINIPETQALEIKKLLTCCIENYNQLFPFLDLFSNYVDPPGKISKRYAVTS
ncbi:MAG: hypothetical protein K0U39_06600 [Alphaproteobacteria bacterium]|nr:hypothetical protein [Alphaproteobacteria bacterium]